MTAGGSGGFSRRMRPFCYAEYGRLGSIGIETFVCAMYYAYPSSSYMGSIALTNHHSMALLVFHPCLRSGQHLRPSH